jgi:hypothetical protein
VAVTEQDIIPVRTYQQVQGAAVAEVTEQILDRRVAPAHPVKAMQVQQEDPGPHTTAQVAEVQVALALAIIAYLMAA